MASDTGKENIADGLIVTGLFKKAPSLSPRKSSRRARSKSIGPGGLEVPEQSALKETSGNRRKSAFVPAVKSILASNDEDEKKKRRKSLARRRVSFAPEATLHTWDVVEYLRDATSSSASSDATRRASNATQASVQPSSSPSRYEDNEEERPSTPPISIVDPAAEPSSSPANQRDLHQKKNRRSSGIPPMNFNNPDDILSSSPLAGEDDAPVQEGDSDEEDVTMQIASSPVGDSEESARLDAALRQATAHAGTQRLDLDSDDEGDMSMELAEDEITTSFKPWARKSTSEQKEDEAQEEEDGEDMSMDMTRAIGKIVQQAQETSSDLEDMSMDLTMPLGVIKSTAAPANRRKSLKRRASLYETSQGSPAKRPASRRASMNRESPPEADETVGMDLTVAIGTIKNLQPARRNSTDTSLGEETMDFTVAMGSIKDVQVDRVPDSDPAEEDEMSMDITRMVGGILKGNNPRTPEKRMSVMSRITALSKIPTPRKSPLYPVLPMANTIQTTSTPPTQAQRTPERSVQKTPELPRIPPPSEQIEMFEPSPFVHRTAPTPDVPAAEDPIAAPILSRRRTSLSAVQFSPLAPPRAEMEVKSAATLSNNIKLLSTPRKQSLVSPMKHGLTPKKSRTPQKSSTPKAKTPTPKKPIPSPKKATPRKSMSPVKRVAFGVPSPKVATEPETVEDEEPEAEDEVARISLQEFLDMTKIRFMELSTTKRRHTAAPSAFRDIEVEEKEETRDRYVVAAACTLPEYELYQHACHEMKKYISDGRHFVRTLEANVMEENPLLFSEYITAPPNERALMDNQFKNLKTNARLEARGEWYTWRSTLLRDLKAGLLSTMEGFVRDETALAKQESLLDAVLPPLVDRHEKLEVECKQLQQRHDELNSCDREELEQARERLVSVDADLAEKRKVLEQLQQDLAEKEARIEAVKERKVEVSAEIKAAERVREECRGWTTSEVMELQDRVSHLERTSNWSITTATPTTLTLTHASDLELSFHPAAFNTGSSTPNASISLTYVGDSATPHPRPLTTSKRFFLQLIRAHLHCLPQSQTRIPDLLRFVQTSWSTTLDISKGVHCLQREFITDEVILSDERIAIVANLLLPSLQTKIKCRFEVEVAVDGKAQGLGVKVKEDAELVYGEKYKVDVMREFLRKACEGRGFERWGDAVRGLGEALVRRGRKGERM
ncbi:Spc7-domain-containing protein [Sporormia fimetaria CBS 119925]|uniref:Spc7-domain-containing protein n=1 Tax=Sporormia fimetaria CBS 119925 TaxID=1340428 RepID=A0A6A6VAQ7_9PLEO|nr:Spc7-domain-containing protein [Sporormia fimetaria CBS 119925]